MSPLLRIKLSQMFFSASFTISILIAYLNMRGVSLSQCYQILGAYYIAVVLLEFPTGVIGDYFSHRTSVMLGYGLTGFGILLTSFVGGYWYYLFCQIVIAMGMALASGSDTALLHHYSHDFAKDNTNIKIYTSVILAASLLSGPLLMQWFLILPIILTATSCFIAAGVVWTLPGSYHTKRDGNIFSTAFRALRTIRGDRNLVQLMTLSGLFGAYIWSSKWFQNPLMQALHIPLPWWGVFSGLIMASGLGGVVWYRHHKISRAWPLILLFLVCIAATGWTAIPIVSLGALYFGYVLYGYIETHFAIVLNQQIKTQERASILSLQNLLFRLGASVYMPITGFTLERTGSFPLLMSATALLLFAGAVFPLYRLVKENIL